MNKLSYEFSKFIVDSKIIIFGDYTLKSGRKSPYFFNFNQFSDANKLDTLSKFYGQYILENKIDFEIVYGPAYKGIPLAISTALNLRNSIKNVQYAFNRKESKNYGDGGSIVGADINGKTIVVIDDVMTSGKTVNETKLVIEQNNGRIQHYIVAIDRQEKGIDSSLTAIQLQNKTNTFPVSALTTIEQIILAMQTDISLSQQILRMKDYIHKYCDFNI